RFTARDVERLMRDESIVRNRAKIESTIDNARAIAAVREDHGSFDAFVWAAVGGAPIVNAWRSIADVPSMTPASQALSKLLKKHGFRFVGPTTCYAFMQAVGMVDDHEISCFRHTRNRASTRKRR